MSSHKLSTSTLRGVHPVPEYEKRYAAASELLRALTAPLRVSLVLALADGPKHVYELVELVGAPQPLVSQHLKVLRTARVVRRERHGREVAYALTDTHVAHIVQDAVQHASESE